MKKILSIFLAAVLALTAVPLLTLGEPAAKELPTAYAEKSYKECIASFEQEDVSASVTEGELPVGTDLVAVQENKDDKAVTAVYLAGTPQKTGDYAFTVEFTSLQGTGSDTTEGVKETAKYSLTVKYPTIVLPDAHLRQDYKACLYAVNADITDIKAEMTDGYMPDEYKITIEVRDHDEIDTYMPAYFYLEGTPSMHSSDDAPYSFTFTVTFSGSSIYTVSYTYTVNVNNDAVYYYEDLGETTVGEEYSHLLFQMDKDWELDYNADSIPQGLELAVEPAENTYKQLVYLKGKSEIADVYHFSVTIRKIASSSEAADDEEKIFYYRLEVRDNDVNVIDGYVGEYYHCRFYTLYTQSEKYITITPKEGCLPEGFGCKTDGVTFGEEHVYHFYLCGTPEKAGFYDIEIEIGFEGEDAPVAVLSFPMTVLEHYTELPRRNILYYPQYANREMLLMCFTSGSHIDSESIALRGIEQLGLVLNISNKDDNLTVQLGGRNMERNPYRYIFNLEYYVEGAGLLRRTFSVYVVVGDYDMGTFTVGTTEDYAIGGNSIFDGAKSIEIIRDCDGTKLTLTTNPDSGKPELTFSLGTFADKGEHIMLIRINYEDAERLDALATLRFRCIKNYIGDANMDGKINTGDSTCILKYAAGIPTLSDEALAKADITQDGKVNTADAAKILRIVAGIDQFPD